MSGVASSWSDAPLGDHHASCQTMKGRFFRYEYELLISARLPTAHIQFHGTHAELVKAMGDCGDSTPRAQRWRRGTDPIRLSALHFPVGGSRFRPTLEDVMEMLIEEFGVKPAGSVNAACEALALSREAWRRTQVATVVRDAPSEAVRALEGLGYRVDPPKEGPVPDTPAKVRVLSVGSDPGLSAGQSAPHRQGPRLNCQVRAPSVSSAAHLPRSCRRAGTRSGGLELRWLGHGGRRRGRGGVHPAACAWSCTAAKSEWDSRVPRRRARAGVRQLFEPGGPATDYGRSS